MKAKPFELIPAPEGAIFQPFVQDGQPVGKLNIHVDGYEDTKKLIIESPAVREMADKLFAYLLATANTADPVWEQLRREAKEILG